MVEVIHTLDAHRVVEAIDQIYEQPDQEHLILIDTFGGGSEAQDVLAVAAHRIICPMMLSRGDLSETLETANWYLKLRARVDNPDELAGFSVVFSRVQVRLSEDRARGGGRTLPVAACLRGLAVAAAPMSGWTRKGSSARSRTRRQTARLAAHVQNAVKEAGDLLEEIDQLILNPAEVA
jgi:chromosome partitioning protein